MYSRSPEIPVYVVRLFSVKCGLLLFLLRILLLFTHYLVTVIVYDIIAFLLGLILFLVLVFLPLIIRNRE